MFLGRSKFREQILKRVTYGTFLNFKIGPAVPEEIFEELLKKFNFVAMATRVFDGIKFCEQFLKRTSQGTFLPSFVRIDPAVWEEMFKEIVDDTRRTPHHPQVSLKKKKKKKKKKNKRAKMALKRSPE